MPLVLMCGLPNSGKSTICQKIKDQFSTDKPDCQVAVINDYDNSTFSYEIYRDANREKEHRGYLRSLVQKHLSPGRVVILDSMNYIKGFRYELFCVAKNVATTYCVVHCSVDEKRTIEVNAKRDQERRYPEDILEAMALRFEPPDSRNRWDNPLFIVTSAVDDETVSAEVVECLMNSGRVLKPNQSTQSQPLAPTNFLYELDKACQSIVDAVFTQMKTSMPGDELTVPGTMTKVSVTKLWTLSDLSRLKRQFVKYAKLNPVEDVQKLANMFVTFLNNSS